MERRAQQSAVKRRRWIKNMGETPWFVMLTEPQQDLTTVWRLHELGLELFVPVLRRRINTGRIHNRIKITRIAAKPMFPGYGFLRNIGIDHRRIEDVRGVRGFLRNERNNPVQLPDQVIQTIFQCQNQELQKWLEAQRHGRSFSHWKQGDRVRIDLDGSAYAGLLATIDAIDSHGRIEVLFGMIRTIMPPDMVIAA